MSRRSKLSALSVAEVLSVPCRICRADVDEPCTAEPVDIQRGADYRDENPHTVRVGDAREAIFGRRW